MMVRPSSSSQIRLHMFKWTLFAEASAQISRYADSDLVRELVKTTELHKLVVIYQGAEMAVCEEV